MQLPAIIDIKNKRVLDGMPYEVLLLKKLVHGNQLESYEKVDIKRLIDFYYKQIDFFRRTVPSTLTSNECLALESHFRKVFDASFLLLVDLMSNTFYRSVVNRKIVGTNTRIGRIEHVINPSIEIIKSIGKYGRANTPENSILYLSNSESETMTENEYQVGDLITVSIWKQVRDFKVLPIVLEFDYSYPHDFINRTVKAYDNLSLKMDSQFIGLIKEIHGFIGSEFSKSVTNHLDYLYTANFSYNIFKNAIESKDKSPIAIVYPGVKCDYKYFNIAFEPSLYKDYVCLHEIKEIRIKRVANFRIENGVIREYDITGFATVDERDGKLIWD